MSGIGAIFHRNGQPVQQAEIDRMAQSLAMYGPERQTTALHGSLGFAYTHYSDVPESQFERQPLLGGNGRYVMVFDGRLDNRDELAESLTISKEELALLPDSGVAMRA